MGTNLRAFFEQADRDFLAVLRRQLLEADRGGQPRGAAANDHHIVFHRIAISTHGQSQNRFSGKAKTDALPPVISAA